MTVPQIAPHRPRLCARDGFELVLDLETARKSIDAGWPAVELLRCRLGHSVRVWPVEVPRRRWHAGTRPCAVCGGPLPLLRDHYAQGGRKYHAGPCTSFASRARSLWSQQHPTELFVLERQPWFKGPFAVVIPLPPLDPLAGRMPRDWAEGYLSLYGGGV